MFFEYLFEYLAQIGLGTAVNRAIAFGAAGILPIVFQTRISYYPTGEESNVKKKKKFALLTTDAETPKEQQTYIHFSMWPILFALFGGLIL